MIKVVTNKVSTKNIRGLKDIQHFNTNKKLFFDPINLEILYA